MPRLRPIIQHGRPISLGGSPRVGGSWDDSRLSGERAPDPVPELALRLVPLTDRSGWHLAALDDNRAEVGRLAYRPGDEPGRPWLWAAKDGASGYERSRPKAVAALAIAAGLAPAPPARAPRCRA